MHQVFAELFGGVGLFLLGMTLMTNGLKDATGETLKKGRVKLEVRHKPPN